MSKDHLVVLGAGPGGYTAAFYAADLGYKVTLVDANDKPGGVCLHRGCIPSKALLHVAGLLRESRQAKEWGVCFDDPTIDLELLRGWKEGIVGKMSGGLVTLCKQRGVSFINQRGAFENSNTLKLAGGNSINFDRCVLATGSQPAIPDNFRNAGSLVMDSTTALNLPEIPERLLIVGGGYIGLEMGSVYSALGSRVTVVEMTDGLLPGVDRDLVRPLQALLKNEFESIRLTTKVLSVAERDQSGFVTMETAGERSEETFDRILVSVGRRPNTSGLGLENTKVELDDKGFVKVDLKRQTSDPTILAIGDVAGEPMLAHKASHEARVAVDYLSGKNASFADRVIPAVVFTDPEIAWCGLTESEARSNNVDVYKAVQDEIQFKFLIEKVEELKLITDRKELEKEFSSTYKNTHKWKKTFKFPWDSTGESVSHNIMFRFDIGDQIEINCTKYKKSLKIENNWSDSLQITIHTKEIMDWFSNPIN